MINDVGDERGGPHDDDVLQVPVGVALELLPDAGARWLDDVRHPHVGQQAVVLRLDH